jgi:hypothetical protein
MIGIGYFEWVELDYPRHVIRRLAEIGSIRMSRLSLVLRGYLLELNARESSISGAGYGVYMINCTPPLSDGSDDTELLILKAGELVDLGLYGLFLLERIDLIPCVQGGGR